MPKKRTKKEKPQKKEAKEKFTEEIDEEKDESLEELEDEEDSELEEVLEDDEELDESSEVALPFYPNQGSASLDQIDATRALIPLEEQAQQAPLHISPKKSFAGYNAASPASYDSNKKGDYKTSQDSDTSYESGTETTSSEKDLRGYEGIGAARDKDNAEENPFLDPVAGARGRIQTIGESYQQPSVQEGNFQDYQEKSVSAEIDVEESKRKMKREFFDA